MREGRSLKVWRWATLLGVAALIFGLDQLSKYLVTRYLPWGERWNPIPSLRWLVGLTPVTNTGGAFGLLPDLGTLFALVAVAVVIAILFFERHIPLNQPLLRVSLGMQLGGAAGNLIDRLRIGRVIDFIDFKVWPVFNLADSAIVVGVVILAFYLLRHPEEEGKGEAPILNDGREDSAEG